MSKEYNLFCDVLEESWKGEVDFVAKKRLGKGILTIKGKEYFVEHNSKGDEISRKRTFEGIRLMIIGNRFFI